MNNSVLLLVACCALTACADDVAEPVITPPPTSPPFQGTIFIDPDIITPNDPTTFTGVTAAGRGTRTMFDRRVNGWITVDAFLFNASFNDGLNAEIQVNPEFGSASTGQPLAELYARAIGRLPGCQSRARAIPRLA